MKMIEGNYIENTSPTATLKERVEQAYREYIQTNPTPPNLAIVCPYLCEVEHTQIVHGHEITVQPGSMIGRWITWIGEGE